MNKTIVERWNSVVGFRDTVFHLGDFCKRGNPLEFIKQMNGKIIFVEGNHDESLKEYNVKPLRRSVVFHNGDEDLLLIHAVEYIRDRNHEWVIHGHHHNNNLKLYPLINSQNKTMNVSAELLDYTPIEAVRLLSMRKKHSTGTEFQEDHFR
jgi:calcineurin-like phosphoesterase family protein